MNKKTQYQELLEEMRDAIVDVIDIGGKATVIVVALVAACPPVSHSSLRSGDDIGLSLCNLQDAIKHAVDTENFIDAAIEDVEEA